MNKKFKNIIEFGAFRLVKLLMFPFPDFIKKSFFVFLAKRVNIRKKIVLSQLKMVFPQKTQKEIEKIAMGVQENLALFALEFYFTDREKLMENIRIVGEENLKRAYSIGKGVILVNVHIGNWEVGMNYIVAKRGVKLNAIVKKMRNEYLDEYTNNLRRDYGLNIICLDQVYKKTLKALKNKETVCIMVDQNAHKMGIKMNFLGHSASVFGGAAKLAIKSGATILPVVCIREHPGFKIYIDEPFSGSEYYKNDVTKLTKKINSKLEKYIYKYPKQWFWVHKRW